MMSSATLRVCVAVTLGLCGPWLAPAQAFALLHPQEQLFSVDTGEPVDPSVLLNALDQADVSVWGEIHDNPRHHALRADVLRAMRQRGLSVVAEHLDAGQRADLRLRLPDALTQAGFDTEGWQWPLHQVLFEAVRDLGLSLYGGNVPASQTREIFKTLGQNMAPEVQQLLQHAPLDAANARALRQEIDEGHCGALPAHLFEGMIAVQRARDASMAAELLRRVPAVLLAGNGHAWKHLGVPQILRAHRPALRVVSLLLIEHAPFSSPMEQRIWLDLWQGKADFMVVTPVQPREDPCLNFQKK